jgi:hypothetical protein
MVPAAHGPHPARQHTAATAVETQGGGSGRTATRATSGQGPQAPRHPEESLLAALAAAPVQTAVRYRGFVLLPQKDLGWLVRPERSPMTVLPFRTPPISLSDVKALVDWRLDAAQQQSKG